MSALFLIGCGKHECDGSSSTFMEDDQGIYRCQTKGETFRPSYRKKIYEDLDCDRENYSIEIDDNILKCTNSFGDLYMGKGFSSIHCAEGNLGRWIKIDIPNLDLPTVYFECNENNYRSLQYIVNLISNDEKDGIYNTCTLDEEEAISSDRSSFICEE